LPREYVGKFIHEEYIVPALMRNDKTVTIKAGEACQRLKLNLAFDDVDFVCGVLGSMNFRNKYHWVLEAIEGQNAGPAATTYRFGLDLAKTSPHILR
jgi:hypothetical protein